MPLELEGQGVSDEAAGEPYVYLESCGCGPILFNTKEDIIRKNLAILDLRAQMQKDLRAMNDKHERDQETLRKSMEEDNRKALEEERRKLAREEERRMQRRREAGQKGVRTRTMHYWEDRVKARQALQAEQKAAKPIPTGPINIAKAVAELRARIVGFARPLEGGPLLAAILKTPTFTQTSTTPEIPLPTTAQLEPKVNLEPTPVHPPKKKTLKKLSAKKKEVIDLELGLKLSVDPAA